MLHMIVNTHDAEGCALRNAENQEVLGSGFRKLPEAATAHGAEVKGMWANMAAHTAFVLIDAPNAHAVDLAMRDAGLVGQTDTRVYAIDEMEKILQAVAEASGSG